MAMTVCVAGTRREARSAVGMERDVMRGRSCKMRVMRGVPCARKVVEVGFVTGKRSWTNSSKERARAGGRCGGALLRVPSRRCAAAGPRAQQEVIVSLR
jgi:hypothetical protein